MKTSACSMSPRNAVLPASDRRSRTTLRLPRFTLTKTPLIPGAGPTEMYRVLSPSGGSTLITSAPMSAMTWVQYGPMTIAVRSTTRRPASGPVPFARLPICPSFRHVAAAGFFHGKPCIFQFVERNKCVVAVTGDDCQNRQSQSYAAIDHGFLSHHRSAEHQGSHPEALFPVSGPVLARTRSG